MTRKLLTPALFGIAVLSTACGGSTSSSPTASTSAPPAAVSAPAAAQPTAAAVPTLAMQIRHQMKGCHAWSFNGGPYRATQAIQIPVGATLKVVDDDIMPHTLIQTSGPSAAIIGAAMAKMNASSAITFAKPGVYDFVTKAGEDYPSMGTGMATIGEDNVLKLKVVVS